MQLVGRSGKLWGVVHAKHYNYFTSKPLRRFTFTPSITIISHQSFNCFPALFPSLDGVSLSEEMCRSTIISPSAAFGHLYLLYCCTPPTPSTSLTAVHIFGFSTKLPVSHLLLHFFMPYTFLNGLRSIFLPSSCITNAHFSQKCVSAHIFHLKWTCCINFCRGGALLQLHRLVFAI